MIFHYYYSTLLCGCGWFNYHHIIDVGGGGGGGVGRGEWEKSAATVCDM